MNCKGVRRSGRSLISGTAVYCYEGGKENKKLRYGRRSADRNWRPGPPEHKARAPPTEAQQRYDSSKHNILKELKADQMNKLCQDSIQNQLPSVPRMNTRRLKYMKLCSKTLFYVVKKLVPQENSTDLRWREPLLNSYFEPKLLTNQAPPSNRVQTKKLKIPFTSRDIPQVLRNPKVYYRLQHNPLSPWPVVRDMLVCYDKEQLTTHKSPSWRITAFGCPWMFILHFLNVVKGDPT
jgi:hypothetical protein